MADDLVLNTWENVKELQRKCPPPQGNAGGWIFRGQGDLEWGLKPSLSRLLCKLGLEDPDNADQVKRAVEAEAEGLRAFQMAHPVKADRRAWIYWWSVAQHYGGLTRVLDWSGQLGVAIYMAARSHLHPDKDGAVFALDTSKLKPEQDPKLYNSPRTDKGWAEQQEILRSGEPLTIHWCRAETPHIRLRVQDGWFTTCTNVLKEQEAVIKAKWSDALKKYKIPRASKRQLLIDGSLRDFSGLVLFCDSSEKAGYAQREEIMLQAMLD